jgi:hypothetical protein
VPPQPPTSGLTLENGPIVLGPGDFIRSFKHIKSNGYGIEGPNNVAVGQVKIDQSLIESKDYGIYLDRGLFLIMADTTIKTVAGGQNPYGIRSQRVPDVRLGRVIVDTSAQTGKSTVRLASVNQLGSGFFDCTFKGSPIHLGGGLATAEVYDAPAFGNFEWLDSTFEGTSGATLVELLPGCGNAGPVLIENVRFSGPASYCFSIWADEASHAKNITIKNCTYNGVPLNWSHVHKGKPARASANNIRIIP